MYQDKHKKSREAITYQIKYTSEHRILLEIDKYFSGKVVNLSIQHSNLSGTVSNNKGPKHLLKRHGWVYSDSCYFYTLLSVVDRTDRQSVRYTKFEHSLLRNLT